MSTQQQVFGLIGYPLSHSFSQKYFTEKFEREGLADTHRFELFEISDMSQFGQQVLAKYPGLKGFAITIPYKKAIIPLLDDTSHLPLPACNCVRIENGRLTGYNTDVVGFEQSLLENLKPVHNSALILGTGGAAEAVKYVLQKTGIPFTTVSRTPASGLLTYATLTPEKLAETKLIINCTPVGTYPYVQDCPDLPYEALTSSHYLFDLIYNPSETMFLHKGKKAGATVKNGYDMLTIQAEANWKIWNS